MHRIRMGLITGVSLALLLAIIQNTAPVEARFLWFSGEVPVILLLVLTGVGGFIIGLLTAYLNRRGSGYDPFRGGEKTNQQSAD